MDGHRNRAVGRIYLWQGGSLWLARSSGTVDTHEHHAIQISVAIEGSMGLKTPEDAGWRSYPVAIIPYHQPHALTTTDALTGLIFVDPESHEGRLLTERFGTAGIVPPPADMEEEAVAALASACGRPLSEESMVGAAHEVIRILTAGAKPRVVVDPRIRQAIDLVKERIPAPVRQEEIAASVFLSPSRFRHLFVEQTGMAFRPYVLWLRLHRALASFTAGESLTSAADVAGFADVAHLSRTFRRMFGINPTSFDLTSVFPLARTTQD